MNSKKRINWVDGMLINKGHFKGMENFLLSSLYNTNRFLSAGAYGLLSDFSESDDYPQIKLAVDSSDGKNQRIIVEQIELNALTSSGTFISVTNDNFCNQKLKTDCTKSPLIVEVEEQKIGHGDPLYLVMLIQPDKTIGVGVNNESEEPLRNPYCITLAELRCVSSTTDTENIVGLNHFPIAKIKIINHRLEIDRNYIPPCFVVTAHNKLNTRVLGLKEKLSVISNNIDAFMQNNQDVSEKNTSFLKSIYFVLYSRITENLLWLADEQELLRPNQVFRMIHGLVLLFKKLLLCNSDAYSFFTETWNTKYGINLHSFSTELEHLSQVKYYDIVETVEVCEKMVEYYLIRITEIDNYTLSGYKPRVSSEPDPDIIL